MWWSTFALFALAADPGFGPTWQRVEPMDALASSYLHSAWNAHDENYHPRYVLDGDPATAWQEGAPGDGAGERLDLLLAPIAGVREVGLRVRSGYQKSKTLWQANGAPVEVRVTLTDANGVARHVETVKLENRLGWQTLSFPAAVDGLAGVSVELIKVRPGRTYRDTAISDLELFVQAPDALDKTAATARAQNTAAWITARRAEASQAAPTGPLDGASFTAVFEKTPSGNPLPDAWAQASALLDKTFANGSLERVESVLPTPPLPPAKRKTYNTLFELGPYAELLSLSALHFGEATSELRLVTKGGTARLPSQVAESNALVLRDAAGAPVALAWRSTIDQVYDYRMSTTGELTTQLAHLVVYENGRASTLYTRSAMEEFEWDNVAMTQLQRLRYDDGGRLIEIENLTWRGRDGEVDWYHALFRRAGP